MGQRSLICVRANLIWRTQQLKLLCSVLSMAIETFRTKNHMLPIDGTGYR
jgi:hypothetical protein